MKKVSLFLFVFLAFEACGNKQSSQAGVEVDSLANAVEAEVSKYAEQVKQLQTAFEKSAKNEAEIAEYTGTIGDQKAKLTIIGYEIMQYYGSLELGEGDAMETIYLKGYQEVALLSLEGYSADQKYQFEALYQEDNSLDGTLKIDDKELKAKLKEKGPKEDPEITALIEEYKERVEGEKEALKSFPVTSSTFMRYSTETDELEGKLDKKKSSMSSSQLDNYKALKKLRTKQIEEQE